MINRYASLLARRILNDHGNALRHSPNDWRLVVPAYLQTATSAAALAEALLQQLAEQHAVSLQAVYLNLDILPSLKRRGGCQIMNQIKRRVEARTGHLMPREHIVTAGDRMGTTRSLDSDAAYFVYGAHNLALGDEACAGADTSLLGQGPDGLLDYLRS